MSPTSSDPPDPHSDLDSIRDANTLSVRSPDQAGSHAPTQLPHRIGDYVIVGKLGEGGMGVVYEAEQQHPKRRVALKVVRGGRFVSEIQVKMFEREAETLARLKHPNIAAIYESGRTEDGQHFFAMELVRGETLDAYAKRQSQAGVRERLGLFRSICDAVNYAHLRGVIHRDLKPSNIVVATDEVTADGRAAGAISTSHPQLKILDFGLARITDTDVAASIVSEVGAIKGTLPYMSPEQARGLPEEIDLRADVYSLGVILYELLSGRLPYDTQGAPLLDAARVICEEPPKPLRSGANDTAMRVDSDVETIVLKSLEKDPVRRYQSAAALADDIERYLTSQPILARPPSTVYQLKKLVARNKLPFAFAGGVVALLAAFGVWMSVLYSRAEVARQDSEAVTDFLSGMLAAVDPGKKGKDVTVREILDEAAKSVGEIFESQPLVRARLMLTMGDVYRKLGFYAEARPPLEGSLAIREKALGSDHPDVAESLNSLAVLLWTTGDHAGARPLYERALAVFEKAFGPDHPNVAEVLDGLVGTLRQLGEESSATSLKARAKAIREKHAQPNHVQTEETKMTSSDLDGFAKRYAEASCSQRPERVASFFATGGSLRVNGGAPAVGREAIAEVAKGFMAAFPDRVVTMDELIPRPQSVEFHWTLTGTNTGPGGAGKRVRISGHEEWRIDAGGLVAESKCHFDAADRCSTRSART